MATVASINLLSQVTRIPNTEVLKTISDVPSHLVHLIKILNQQPFFEGDIMTSTFEQRKVIILENNKVDTEICEDLGRIERIALLNWAIFRHGYDTSQSFYDCQSAKIPKGLFLGVKEGFNTCSYETLEEEFRKCLVPMTQGWKRTETAASTMIQIPHPENYNLYIKNDSPIDGVNPLVSICERLDLDEKAIFCQRYLRGHPIKNPPPYLWIKKGTEEEVKEKLGLELL